MVSKFAVLLALLLVLTALADSLSKRRADAAPAIVPCSDLTVLRDQAGSIRTSTNSRTGHKVEYLLIGDAASSSQILVFFNGTSQIIPDWPTQMITNRARSPLIALTPIYRDSENGPNSLCHDYRLLFFDYPGVGLTSGTTNYNTAQVADDVDALLSDVGQTFSIPTNDVSLIGWSLGTLTALKFATLSQVASPSRIIHNIILIATKPGGGLSPPTTGNGAQCVDTTFDNLVNPSTSPILRLRLVENNFDLLFPYIGEPQNDGPSINCVVTVDTSSNTVSLNVTTNCNIGTICFDTFAEWTANRLRSPWSITGGVSTDLLITQRDQDHDIEYGYCPTAGPNFTPLNCTFSQPPVQSALSGGVCLTSSPVGFPNQPTSNSCVPLTITGRITVVNGFQDLYIQHTYGAALVQGFQQVCGTGAATLDTYPGSGGAGHGVLLQHPEWTQEQIAQALAVGAGISQPIVCVSSCAPSPGACGNLTCSATSATTCASATSTTPTQVGNAPNAPALPGSPPDGQPAVLGLSYCYPAPNAPPPGVPCTPFTGFGSPVTGVDATLAFCQTYYGTLAAQQACIASALGNVGGFICFIGCGIGGGIQTAPKPPAPRPSGRYCTLPDGAMQYVVTGAPVPEGAIC
jgi:pimeloyl-ACP methyl ester carboxylesterase